MGSGIVAAFLPCLLLGGVLGGIGGMFGIGGGIIAIPVLALQGTALVMMLPNVLIAFWRYRQRNPFPLRTAILIGLASTVSTYPAARLAVAMDTHLLKVCFALFLVCLSAYFFYNSRAKVLTAEPATAWNRRYLPAVGIVGGLFGGIFSVGAGIVATPIFVRGFGKRQAVAQGLSLALVMPGVVMALLTFTQAQQVDEFVEWQGKLQLPQEDQLQKLKLIGFVIKQYPQNLQGPLA